MADLQLTVTISSLSVDRLRKALAWYHGRNPSDPDDWGTVEEARSVVINHLRQLTRGYEEAMVPPPTDIDIS